MDIVIEILIEDSYSRLHTDLVTRSVSKEVRWVLCKSESDVPNPLGPLEVEASEAS